MAWRLRLNTKRHYLDFEWGRPEPEPQGQPLDPAPQMNDQPMQVYAEPIGFRFASGGEFATEIQAKD